MSVPERIWATGNGVNGSWVNTEMPEQWGLVQSECIRADIHAARIADLERQLAEARKIAAAIKERNGLASDHVCCHDCRDSSADAARILSALKDTP